MSPPVICYAITDRRLHAADERDPANRAPSTAQPPSPAIAAVTPPPVSRDSSGDAPDMTQAAADPFLPAATLSAHQMDHLLRQARHLRATGVDYLQLREKDLAPADLHTLATSLRQAFPPGSRPRLLLNLGHPEHHTATLGIALAIAADGLHLPGNSPADLPARIRTAFRRACRSTPILSTSAHTLAGVAQARANNLDLILFGPVFGKTVFGDVVNKTVVGESALGSSTLATPSPALAGQLVTPALGLEALAAAVDAAGPIPLLALGGITDQNSDACLAAGARGLAGIRLFLTPAP